LIVEIPSNLIGEAKKNGIKQIVKLSVFQSVGTIVRLHRHEEKIIEESGIPYTLSQSSAFMQNFINFFDQTIKMRADMTSFLSLSQFLSD
jgi:uncharacterized protein YbjT (DUF2867 family)